VDNHAIKPLDLKQYNKTKEELLAWSKRVAKTEFPIIFGKMFYDNYHILLLSHNIFDEGRSNTFQVYSKINNEYLISNVNEEKDKFLNDMIHKRWKIDLIINELIEKHGKETIVEE
jgi:hypothetical protein